MNGFIRRFSSLVYKETLQVLRDPSTILLGVVLPILLIILIGSGVTLDVKHVPIAVVMERQDSMTQSVYDSLYGSEYFQPIAVRDRKTAELLMEKRKVDAILVIPQDFSAQVMRGQGKVQGIYYGVDTSVTMSIESYVNSAINLWAVKNIPFMLRGGYITMNHRMWFNEANTSTWFLIPGLIMIIMTIVSVFLTAVVMAREWERGTFESLFVTPVKPIEIILAKVVPYYVLAMLGLLFCLGVSYFFYEVPMRGSLWIICIVSTLYLIVSLNMGLLISALTKKQFLACQMALLTSFLPALILTGFLFDPHSQPVVIQYISRLLPPTYFLELLKSLFLGGNNWYLIIKNSAVLSGFAICFTILTIYITRKKVE